MTTNKFKPINLLKKSIGQRIKKLRTDRNLTKSAVLIDDDDPSRGSGNGTLIYHIEKGDNKPRTKSFIPNQSLDLIAKKFYPNDPNRKFKIVYGNYKNRQQDSDGTLMSFIHKIYDQVAYNFTATDYDKKIIKDFSETAPQLQQVTQEIINGLFFDASFTWYWYEDKNNSSDSNKSDFFPEHFSNDTSSYFYYAAQDFFDQIKNVLFNSYNEKFIKDDSKISLKKFDEKIYSWIESSWPKIINDQIQTNKNNIIFSIGYDVQNIINGSGVKLLTKLQKKTIQNDQLFLNFYKKTQTKEEDMIKLQIEEKEFNKTTMLIDELLATYKENAKSLRDMQEKVRKETPEDFKNYFTNHWTHFAKSDSILNDLSDYDFFDFIDS